MGIQYDKLNEAYSALRTVREEFVKGTLTTTELAEQETKIKADIREILALPPVTP